MEKKKDPIGARLREMRKQRNVSVPALSVLLDIPKDRMYKWEQGVSTPDFEDREKITAWMKDGNWNNVPRETNPLPMHEQDTSRTLGDYITMIENHNRFLQRLLESALVDIGDSLRILLTNSGDAKQKSGVEAAISDAERQFPDHE